MKAEKYYKNIVEALEVERPGDKILKQLSNNFAIVQSMYENGTYEDQASIMGLSKNIPMCYGKADRKSLNKFSFLISWINEKVKTMGNTEKIGMAYGIHPWIIKIQDNRKYKQQYFKLLKLLNETDKM